ncbi:MAG: hypothetical protein HYY77_02200 [Betaproteobacteria bacterium]|nr:hypothetical protein [Betaproteobacteria bacterium]
MRRPNSVLLVGCAAFLAVIGQSIAADWEVKNISDGKKNSCLVVSAAKSIFDGYQQVTAQIIVDNKSVAVKSDSVLDMGSSDIGLKVGKRDLVPADKIVKDKQAIFDSNYDEIVVRRRDKMRTVGMGEALWEFVSSSI